MLTIYVTGGPNPRKITIFLEEVAIPYECKLVDVYSGEHLSPDFLSVNPNGRLPALQDTQGPDGEIVLWESGAILQYMDGVAGIQGWQWIFLLEGAPAVILGFIVFSYLTDRPEKAEWLTAEQRTWLTEQMAREEKYRVQHHGMTLWQAMADGRCILEGMLEKENKEAMVEL